MDFRGFFSWLEAMRQKIAVRIAAEWGCRGRGALSGADAVKAAEENYKEKRMKREARTIESVLPKRQ